jgi:hypothetical protein
MRVLDVVYSKSEGNLSLQIKRGILKGRMLTVRVMFFVSTLSDVSLCMTVWTLAFSTNGAVLMRIVVLR